MRGGLEQHENFLMHGDAGEKETKSKRQAHRKYTAMSLSAFDLDSPAVGFDNRTRNTEPQP